MQLPLPVSLPSDETFDSFVAGDNLELVALLKTVANEQPQWSESASLSSISALALPLILLVAREGRGKSHLLYSLCHQLAHRHVPHVYLNLNNISEWNKNVFDGLESMPCVCLDNVHSVAGEPVWEMALFDFLNRVSEARQCLIVCASRLGANNPAFRLPDLRSRLGWGVTYPLKQLNDEQRQEAVLIRARQRGLKFSHQAVRFLFNHYQRDLPTLISLLERLDTRSLQEQKKISVAMVKRELSE